MESVLVTRKDGKIIAITINDVERRSRIIGGFAEFGLDEIQGLLNNFITPKETIT